LINDHMDIWQHAHGYTALDKWIHSYMNVVTWPVQGGYTWDTIHISFEAGSCTMVRSVE
jgi:hypothetical protein